MPVSINSDALTQILQMNAFQISWGLFINGGWIIFAIIMGKFLWDYRLLMKQIKWASTIQNTFLAVDIPRDNEQMPKAVEQMFATIAGAHMPLTVGERLIEGKFQLSFSFEIISLDGYIQYIIKTPVVYRDLIESAIYAQYPGAEITEVEDYAKDMPRHYPDEKYSVWGSELILSNKDAYPIKTYIEFEDKLSGELKDPMASILETMNNIRQGEQVWFQLIVIPTGFEWVDRVKKVAMKIAGKKSAEAKPNILSTILSSFFGFFGDWLANHSTLMTPGEGSYTPQKRDDMPSLMLHLTPGEKLAVESIERKASKVAFECKMRLVYIAPKELYQPQRVVSSVFGAIKQYNFNDLNGIKPDNMTKTSAYYGFAKMKINYRRGKIMRNYIDRAVTAGRKPKIMNIEELATIYHFPILTVKAPLMPRLDSKKSGAPSYLPLGDTSLAESTTQSNFKQELETLKVNNDYYERKYALDKNKLKPRNQSPRHDEQPAVNNDIPNNLPVA